jgi:Ca-activated chloride channel homolog
LTDIKVDFRGFAAKDVEPQALPDLFALRPLTLLGKYRGQPEGEIVITGKTAKGPFEQIVKVTPAAASPENSALRQLWARQRVQRLLDSGGVQEGSLKAEVTRLGLAYSLMTPFTSFVAVDQVKRADGRFETVKQPLPLPQGVSDLAVGGASPGGHKMLKRMSGVPMAMLAVKPSGEERVLEAHLIPPTVPTPDSGIKLGIQVVKAAGGLEAEAVKSVLAAGLAGWQEQYDRRSRQGIGLPKEFSVSFTLDAKGRVTGTPAVEKTLPEQELQKSLVEILKGLQFAVPRQAPAAVTVKIVLSN